MGVWLTLKHKRFFHLALGETRATEGTRKKEGFEHFCKQMIKLPFKEREGETPCPNKTFARSRKSFLQLFTMLRQPVQSQHGLGALPWSLLLFASRLPAPGSTGYFSGLSSPPLKNKLWPSLSSPIKPPVSSSALIMFSRKVVQLGPGC